MVEPFGAAGLALATLTLPAQIFSSCVLAYTTISDIKTVGTQFSRLFWQFQLQHTRFLVWGQNSNIYEDGVSATNLSQPVYNIIVSTLIQIKDIFKDAEDMGSHYGLQKVAESHGANTQAAEREIRRQATMVFQVQKRCSLLRKLKWTIADANKFASLVQQLTAYNDALYEFCPLMRHFSQTAAVDAEALALAIVNHGLQGVNELRDTLSSSQNPRQASNASAPYLAARAAAFQLGQGVAAMETGHTQHPLPGLYASYQLSFRSFHIQNSSTSRRSLANLRADLTQLPANTVIEWRPYNHRGMGIARKTALQSRVEALTRMLKDSPRTPNFRILDCLGYVEDDTCARYGVVFRYPRPFVNNSGCSARTLNELLQHKKPPFLEDRFRLASVLAESLYEFHLSRWLHKGINSHNVLFFAGNSVPQISNSSHAVRLSDPYISGFTLSRPDDPEAVSELACPDLESGIYQHPDIQGLLGAHVPSFHYIYDMYSLGTVLLEIGTWSTLASFYRAGHNGVAFRSRLLTDKVPLLGVTMGEKYMMAVRKCLECAFDGIRHFQESERATEDYILNLHRSFNWEVVNVLKECRV